MRRWNKIGSRGWPCSLLLPDGIRSPYGGLPEGASGRVGAFAPGTCTPVNACHYISLDMHTSYSCIAFPSSRNQLVIKLLVAPMWNQRILCLRTVALYWLLSFRTVSLLIWLPSPTLLIFCRSLRLILDLFYATLPRPWSDKSPISPQSPCLGRFVNLMCVDCSMFLHFTIEDDS